MGESALKSHMNGKEHKELINETSDSVNICEG